MHNKTSMTALKIYKYKWDTVHSVHLFYIYINVTFHIYKLLFSNLRRLSVSTNKLFIPKSSIYFIIPNLENISVSNFKQMQHEKKEIICIGKFDNNSPWSHTTFANWSHQLMSSTSSWKSSTNHKRSQLPSFKLPLLLVISAWRNPITAPLFYLCQEFSS